MEAILNINEKKESNNGSTLSMVLSKILETYECHSIRVLCDNEILLINEESERMTTTNFKAKSRNGQEIEIITKFIDRGEDDIPSMNDGYIPLINFKQTTNNNYISRVSGGPTIKYCMKVEQFKIIYQKLEQGIPIFTMTLMTLNDIVNIPITLTDGKQIDVTIRKIENNKYVITDIHL